MLYVFWRGIRSPLVGLNALLLLLSSPLGVDHVGERTFVAQSDLVNEVDEGADNKARGAFQPGLPR